MPGAPRHIIEGPIGVVGRDKMAENSGGYADGITRRQFQIWKSAEKLMRALPEAKLFSTHLIDDMHAAFEVVCSRLGLAPTSDKATELVVTKMSN